MDSSVGTATHELYELSQVISSLWAFILFKCILGLHPTKCKLSTILEGSCKKYITEVKARYEYAELIFLVLYPIPDYLKTCS